MKPAHRELQAALRANVLPVSLRGSQIAAPLSSNEVGALGKEQVRGPEDSSGTGVRSQGCNLLLL